MIDLQYYKDMLAEARRLYYVRRVALAENTDLSDAAKQRALANARGECEARLRMAKGMLGDEASAAREEMAALGRDSVKRQLTELYDHAQRLGPAAVLVASRLVELNGPEQLLALHETGDALMQGIIALTMGRYVAGEDDPQQRGAWESLRSEVGRRQMAEIDAAKANLSEAERVWKDLETGPDGHIARIAVMTGASTEAVNLRSFANLTDAEVKEAGRSLSKLL